MLLLFRFRHSLWMVEMIAVMYSDLGDLLLVPSPPGEFVHDGDDGSVGRCSSVLLVRELWCHCHHCKKFQQKDQKYVFVQARLLLPRLTK